MLTCYTLYNHMSVFNIYLKSYTKNSVIFYFALDKFTEKNQ